MRLFITLNFVLLSACLALSQGQEGLKSRGEVQVPSILRARADTPPLGSAKPTDGHAKSNSESHHPPQPQTVKDPKLCAIIVKRMKDFAAMSKNGGLPAPKTGSATPTSGAPWSPKPSASGVARRSKLAQRTEIGSLNRRESSATKDASSSTIVDPNACKEMETMLKAAREKTQTDMKKGMPPPKPDGPKKDSTPKSSPTDAKSKTGSTDTTPKTGVTDATPQTDST
ncbi:secreted protein [Melampsora americana]|nr:secreted protein [Melampsora americana]